MFFGKSEKKRKEVENRYEKLYFRDYIVAIQKASTEACLLRDKKTEEFKNGHHTFCNTPSLFLQHMQ